jgi:hypothetical protein
MQKAILKRTLFYLQTEKLRSVAKVPPPAEARVRPIGQLWHDPRRVGRIL